MLKVFTICSDRGGLLYPSDEFISRLWTIHNFLEAVLPKQEGCVRILKDLVSFLSPTVEKCDTFSCQLARPGETNIDLITCVLEKFISPLLNNHCLTQVVDDHTPIVNPSTKNRRMLTLR